MYCCRFIITNTGSGHAVPGARYLTILNVYKMTENGKLPSWRNRSHCIKCTLCTVIDICAVRNSLLRPACHYMNCEQNVFWPWSMEHIACVWSELPFLMLCTDIKNIVFRTIALGSSNRYILSLCFWSLFPLIFMQFIHIHLCWHNSILFILQLNDTEKWTHLRSCLVKSDDCSSLSKRYKVSFSAHPILLDVMSRSFDHSLCRDFRYTIRLDENLLFLLDADSETIQACWSDSHWIWLLPPTGRVSPLYLPQCILNLQLLVIRVWLSYVIFSEHCQMWISSFECFQLWFELPSGEHKHRL
jgi:hypothetical protein